MKDSKKQKYELDYREGQYLIFENGKDPILTPHGTIFKTPYLLIAQQVLKDIDSLGPESYTSGFSSLCYAYSYDNMMHQNSEKEIRKMLSRI